jgi:hypothetical protein
MAAHGARRLAVAEGGAGPGAAALDGERAALREEQIACWGLRSRPGGLVDSLDHLWPAS